MQRKKAYTCGAHSGVIAGKFVQLVTQSPAPAKEHPAAAILPQMSEHALPTSVEEQLSAHMANEPVPPPESSRAPHPRAGTSAIAAAAKTILTFDIAFHDCDHVCPKRATAQIVRAGRSPPCRLVCSRSRVSDSGAI
jgi:hypothetical protein